MSKGPNPSDRTEDALGRAGAHGRWAALTPETWRKDLLRIVLRGMAIFGCVVYPPSLLISLKLKLTGVALLDTVSIVAILALARFSRLPGKLRELGTALILYTLGAGLMIAVGSISQIYLFAFSLITTLLLGVRWGLGAVALNAVTMVVIGAAGISSPEMVIAVWRVDLAAWLVMSANFVFVNLVLVLTLGAVIHALESALVRSGAAREALVVERRELLRLNNSLAQEIAERKRTEASLLESKALLGIAGRTARIGGWRMQRGRGLLWSDEVCELHDMPPGTTPSFAEAAAFFAPEWREQVWHASQQCFRAGTPFDLEAELVTAKGTRRWVRTIGNAQRDEAGAIEVVHGSLQDITERKLADAQQAKLEHQLRQAQKMDAVGRLAGGVAHDFNNLLSVILMNATQTQGALSPADPLREGVDEIIDAATRSAALTRQLLTFARQQPIAVQAFDLNEMVGQMLKMLGRLIGEDIHLVWKPAHGTCPVKMDSTQIDQILANLAVNARDAIAGVGQLTIETKRVSFDASYCESNAGYSSGDFIELSVSDSGSGMDKATQARIFEPFFSTKDLGKGTGLGLATVYGIAKQNGGFINVYSELGVGSTFRIYLPRSLEASAPLEAPKAATTLRGTETVLLVEDEEALLRLGKRMLGKLGYTVIAAATPKEALALAEGAGHIDLLVTDVIMPEMTGRDVWLALQSSRPSLKCMYMSGYTSDVISHRGVLDEGVHFLQKPFSLEAMAAKVREALES